MAPIRQLSYWNFKLFRQHAAKIDFSLIFREIACKIIFWWQEKLIVGILALVFMIISLQSLKVWFLMYKIIWFTQGNIFFVTVQNWLYVFLTRGWFEEFNFACTNVPIFQTSVTNSTYFLAKSGFVKFSFSCFLIALIESCTNKRISLLVNFTWNELWVIQSLKNCHFDFWHIY